MNWRHRLCLGLIVAAVAAGAFRVVTSVNEARRAAMRSSDL